MKSYDAGETRRKAARAADMAATETDNDDDLDDSTNDCGRGDLDSDVGYVLRSPHGSMSTSDDIQDYHRLNPTFRFFDQDLRRFFKTYWPQDCLDDGAIQVRDSVSDSCTS